MAAPSPSSMSPNTPLSHDNSIGPRSAGISLLSVSDPQRMMTTFSSSDILQGLEPQRMVSTFSPSPSYDVRRTSVISGRSASGDWTGAGPLEVGPNLSADEFSRISRHQTNVGGVSDHMTGPSASPEDLSGWRHALSREEFQRLYGGRSVGEPSTTSLHRSDTAPSGPVMRGNSSFSDLRSTRRVERVVSPHLPSRTTTQPVRLAANMSSRDYPTRGPRISPNSSIHSSTQIVRYPASIGPTMLSSDGGSSRLAGAMVGTPKPPTGGSDAMMRNASDAYHAAPVRMMGGISGPVLSSSGPDSPRRAISGISNLQLSRQPSSTLTPGTISRHVTDHRQTVSPSGVHRLRRPHNVDTSTTVDPPHSDIPRVRDFGMLPSPLAQKQHMYTFAEGGRIVSSQDPGVHHVHSPEAIQSDHMTKQTSSDLYSVVEPQRLVYTWSGSSFSSAGIARPTADVSGLRTSPHPVERVFNDFGYPSTPRYVRSSMRFPSDVVRGPTQWSNVSTGSSGDMVPITRHVGHSFS